jgi:hypothetical protein
VVVLTGLGFVIASLNAAIRMLFAMDRERALARLSRRRTPVAALGWLCLGAVVAGVLRARRSARLEALGRVFLPAADSST